MNETSKLPVAGLTATQLLAEYRRRQELAIGKYAVRIGEAETMTKLLCVALASFRDHELSGDSKLRIAALIDDRARAIAAKVVDKENES